MSSFRSNKPILMGLFAIALWSFSALLFALLKRIPTFELNGIIALISFLIFSLYISVKAHWDRVEKDIAGVLKLTLPLALMQLLYTQAFKTAPPAHIELITYIWPLLVILILALGGRAKVSAGSYLALFIGFLGVFCLLYEDISLSLEQFTQHLSGYMYAFSGMGFWALYNLYQREGNQNSLYYLVPFFFITGVGLTLVQAILGGWVWPSSREWFYLTLLGIGPSGTSLVIWEYALTKGSLKTLVPLSYLIPLLSVFWLIFFNLAKPTPLLILALCLILSSCLISHLKDQNTEKARV